MEKMIQLIQVTPQELQEEILKGIKAQIEGLKDSYQPKEPTEYLTRKEVSELLKINLSTVYNWTNKGKLIPYGLVGRVYYKRSEIEEALIKLN